MPAAVAKAAHALRARRAMPFVPCDHAVCAPLPGRHVATGDARIWTVELGAGEAGYPPIVFVHGIPTTSYLWRNVQRALVPRYRTFAIDLPPLGASAANDGAVSLAHQAERLSAWADALGVPRFTLVAHDVGGGVAHHFAARHRERLAGLVLVDAVAFAATWPVPSVRLLRTPLLGDVACALGPFATLLGRQVRRGFAVPDRLMPCTWTRWYASLAPRLARRRFLRFVRAFAPPAVEAALRESARDRANAPRTLVVWGTEDRFQPLTAGRRLAELLHASCYELPDTGHFVPEEQPHALAALVDAIAGGATASPIAAPSPRGTLDR